MARPLRIEFPGAFYHVMSRGNEKRDIYRNERDRKKFLGYLESASVKYGVVIHSYCLMDNHYHLLLETPGGNLSQIMRHINGAYTAYFNVKHDRTGHLFQGRYRAILVDSDAYCLSLSCYIHLNPAVADVSINPLEYEWSSYRYFCGETPSPLWLNTEFLLSLVGVDDDVKEKYKRHVNSADGGFNELYGEKFATLAVLGRPEFIEELREKHLRTRSCSRDLPAVKKLRRRTEIQDIIEAVSNSLRGDARLAKKMCIYLCHQFSGCSLKEIGESFGVGESAVSENSKRFASVLYKDQRLAETVAGLLAELKM